MATDLDYINELLSRSDDTSANNTSDFDYVNSLLSNNESSNNYDNYSGSNDYQSNIPSEDNLDSDTDYVDAVINNQESKEPEYSVQEAAQQANGGQSYLNAAVGELTGEQPQEKLGLFEKPEIKTTPERDALIEELKKTPYDSSEYAGYATDEMSAAQIQDFSKRNAILEQLHAIDQELGNGEMDYTALDRAGSVFSNANYQIASGLTNAAGTVTRGVGEAINSVTGGEKGQKVIDVGTAMQNMSDNMSTAAQQDVERAKNGLSRFGQAGVDIATNVIQMGFDAAVGAATGGGSLASMFLRSAGNSMQQARNEGASTARQLLYGGVSGGIEVFTEKLADGVAGIYGKGAADDITESLIRKLSDSDFGRSALRLLSGAVSEGGEEVISDLLAPYAELIYNNKGFGETLRNTFNGTYDPSEILYDFVIGATIGALGGGTSVMTGQNANANAQLREADTIQNNLVQNNGLSEADARKAADILAKVGRGEEITKKQQAFLDTVQKANGIDTTTHEETAPQAEAETTPTISAQPEQTQQAEAPAASAPQTQAQQTATQPTTTAAVPASATQTTAESPTTSTPKTVQVGTTYNKEGAGRRITSYNGFEVSGYTNEKNWMQTTTLKAPDGSTITVRHGNSPTKGNAAIKDAVDNWYKSHPNYTLSSQTSGQSAQTTAPQSRTIDERRAKAREDYIEAYLAAHPEQTQKDAEQDADYFIRNMNAKIQNGVLALGNSFGENELNDVQVMPMASALNEYLKTLGYQLDFDNVSVYKRGNAENMPPSFAFKIVPYKETASSQNSAAPQSTPQSNPSPSAPPQNPTQQSAGTAPQPSGTNTQVTSQESSEAGSGELNSKNSGPWVPPTNQPGSKEPKVSQASTNSMRNTAEQNGATQEDLTYIPKPEKESLNNAMNRVAADKVGEMNKLIEKEMWTGEDIDTAMTIYGHLKYDSVNQHDSSAADAWAKIVQEHATKSGQALQAFAKWARTGKAAQMDIDAMLDENTDLTDEQKQQIKEKVQEFSERYDSIEDENDPDALDNLRKLILEQNEYRKTGTFGSKRFEKLLNRETDFNWLKEYAIRQMRSIPADYTEKPTLGQKLKTWQVNAQLTRVGTFFRNLGGNATFGVIDTMAQDFPGVVIDSLVSKFTGKREVAFDKGWLNKNAREAAVKAAERSVLEVAGDVDMTGDPNRYGQTSGRTNKMVGNEAQRFMSRWEQLLGYSLTTSDRVFRGQIETSYTDALVDQYVKTHPDATDEEIKQYRVEAAQIAKEVADYRLFQNQGRAAKLSKGAHDLLNTLSIGGENGQGGFGLGDLLNPYPGVPANLAVKALEYSPANLAKGAYEMAKLIKDAKAGKAVTGQQMTAVMDMARGMSGAPIIALFTALVKTGLFRNSDDEDYDVAAEEAAQNLSGVQWNLSATMRAAQGGTSDWQEGDDIMKVSWLEPLNAFMSIASLLSDSNDDFDLSSMSSKYFEGAIQAALDMPVMENIQNAVNTFKYSSGDTIWQKGLEAGAQLAGDALGGMIPAPISQTARVTDDYVRDTRGDSKAETAYNAFLNSLPGARNSLPVKTDNFGNARENEPNMLLRTLNSFVLPGAISTFRETAVQDEIGKLYEETGDAALYPDRNGPKSIKVDGIDYPLSAEESRAYHEFVGQKSEEYVQALIDNKAYKTLTTDQKKNAVKEMYELAKGLAKDAYISEQGIKTDTVSDATKLLSGIDKAGTSSDKTALNERNLANYIVYSEAFSNSLKAEDYKETDKLAKWYNGMNDNLKTVLLERNTDLKRILEYQKIGLGSETYTKIKTAIPDAQNELDANSTTGSLVRLYGVAKADIPEKDRLAVLEKLVQGDSGFIGANAKAAVSTLKQYGLSVEQTAQFFDIALHCATYKDTGDAKDFKGKLTPENTAFALMQIPGLTDAQRTAAYNSIRSQVSNYYNDWKNYSYSSEVKWFTNPKNKAAYGTNIRISPQGQNALLASAS